MTTPRWQILMTMRGALDRLREEHASAGDESAVARAIATTCDMMGISPHDYARAIEADPELELLEELAIREALAGSTDPGPYAAISRESMSGQPGNTLKSRSRPEPNSPQFDVRAQEEDAMLDEEIATSLRERQLLRAERPSALSGLFRRH